jgi:hypothetical protein
MEASAVVAKISISKGILWFLKPTSNEMAV